MLIGQTGLVNLTQKVAALVFSWMEATKINHVSSMLGQRLRRWPNIEPALMNQGSADLLVRQEG